MQKFGPSCQMLPVPHDVDKNKVTEIGNSWYNFAMNFLHSEKQGLQEFFIFKNAKDLQKLELNLLCSHKLRNMLNMTLDNLELLTHVNSSKGSTFLVVKKASCKIIQ